MQLPTGICIGGTFAGKCAISPYVSGKTGISRQQTESEKENPPSDNRTNPIKPLIKTLKFCLVAEKM